MKAMAVRVNPSKKGKLFQRNSKYCLNIQDAVNKAVLYQSKNLVLCVCWFIVKQHSPQESGSMSITLKAMLNKIEFCIFALKYSFETC